MKRFHIAFILAFTCLAHIASAQIPEEFPLQGIAGTFSSSKAMSNAIAGISAITSEGDTLISWNAHTRMVPASNMKLLSTGTALLSLGPDYRYVTRIGYDGEIEDGILYGNLYIIGGGDPTLGSRNKFAASLNQTFQIWHNAIRNAGIKKIEGNIIGDGRYFGGMKEHGSWSWSDIGTYYGTGVSGLNFFENVLAFNVSHGETEGSPVAVSQTYPKTPWMDFIFSGTTGTAGSGDQLYLYTTDLSSTAELRGTFAIDRNTKTIECSNKFPEYTCASYFADWLEGRGLKCTGGPSDLGKVFDRTDNRNSTGEITCIGGSSSPVLAEIAASTNYESNNLFAETLFRTLGKEFGKEGSYRESERVLRETLEDLMGGECKELHITDGSGLSRENNVSPAFLASYLQAMMKTPAYDCFLKTLPAPASEGTMLYFMSTYPSHLQTRIRLKSGSMGGVRCYSGYILPVIKGNPTITFSIMANNFTASQREVQKEIEKVIAKLAEHN